MSKELALIVKVLNKSRTGFSNTISSLKSFGRSAGAMAKRIGKSIAAGLAIATAGVVAFGVHALRTSLKFTDIEAKFDVVFGNVAKKARVASKALANEFNIALIDVRETMAGFQDLFTGFGGSVGDSARLTEQFTRLGLALKAINPEKSMGDITSALKGLSTGEFEAMKQLGVVVKATELAKAVTAKYGATATKVQKAEVALGLAMAQSANAFKLVKDRTKTSTYQYDRAKVAVKNLTNAIGLQLAAGMGLGRSFEYIANRLERWLVQLDKSKAVEKWATKVKKAMAPVKKLFDNLFTGDKEKRKEALDEIQAELESWAKGLGEVIGAGIARGVKKAVKGGFKDLIEGVGKEQTVTVFDPLDRALEGFVKGLLKEFPGKERRERFKKAREEQTYQLKSVQDFFDKSTPIVGTAGKERTQADLKRVADASERSARANEETARKINEEAI